MTPTVRNILTTYNRKKGFRKSYDDLSEAAHPNWDGLTAAYISFDDERKVAHIGRTSEINHNHLKFNGLSFLFSSAGLALDLLNEIDEIQIEVVRTIFRKGAG